mmetsp:Transcript_41953/g.110847  ORF Transcript_41953/g.110847 Transcript_41953/m.110847 type:complete len:264 (-) Transcript_41953:86-877(-)
MGQSAGLCTGVDVPEDRERIRVKKDTLIIPVSQWTPASCGEDIVKIGSNIIARNENDDDLYAYQQEEGEGEMLLDTPSYVRELAPDPSVVDCARASAPGPNSTEKEEALAALPGFLTADIPEDFVAGMKLMAMGPCGQIEVVPHPDERPGSKLEYPLKPNAEFVIEVPPGKQVGDEMKFARDDGTTISVKVPVGCKPGDTFQVTPPCLMVRLPRGAKPGDTLVFRSTETDWWRAQIPKQDCLKLNKFFFARLPEDSITMATER